MAEYRIIATVDPQTGPGSQKVKQDLRGIQTEAKATETALGRSFDQASFNQSVGGMTSAAGKLNSGLRDTTTEANAVSQSLLGVKSAGFEADKGVSQFSSALKANRLQTNQSRIGMMEFQHIARGVSDQYASSGLSTQLFTSHLGELSEALVLTSSSAGAVGKFLQGPWGIALTLATVVIGPMIAKLFETNSTLDDQIKKLHDDAVAADLTREAHERWSHTLDGLIDRQGKLADAMRDRLKVQGLTNQSDLQQAEHDLTVFQKSIADQKNVIAGLQRQLREASAPVELTGGRGDEAKLGEQALRIAGINSQIKAAQTQLDRLQGAADKAQTRIVGGQIVVGEEQGKALVDLTARAKEWEDRYTDALRGILQTNKDLRAQTPEITAGFELVSKAVDHAASAGLGFQSTLDRAKVLGVELKDGQISVAGYRSEMTKLAAALEKAAEAAEKAKRTTSDGVATFVSARQAIGIAGRELQSAGLHVSENSQFGGVTPGVHTGAGHADDRAIDVNQGKGIVESDVPDIRAKFDAMAIRYAARGYIVLWNRKRYAPNGGPITGIPGGQDQHLDHMHIEAPTAIVGKPTQASTESLAEREERQGESAATKAANTAREKGDFVTSILDQQNLRGLESGPESLTARMDKIVGDYKRRFNTDTMPEADQKKIREALIGGDERTVQQQFYTTYEQPLLRLQALQGKTGLDRQVLNAQLAESVKQFGPLTEGYNLLSDAENKTIETGIRHGDQLSREAALLEEVRRPMDEYRKMVEALNALLAKGEISQAAYNARLAEMNNQATQSALGGLKGGAPDGRSYEDIAATSEEAARYAAQLNAIDEFRKKKLDIGVSYDQLELDAAKQHQQNLAAIEQARTDMQLGAAEDIAAGVTSSMKSMFGEQSRMYKAAFAVEKAVAIARSIMAIQTGIAQASAEPFPLNLVAIASVVAATASIIANIEAVALNFKDGGLPTGLVRGPGGPRSDSINANISRDEFIVNADATRRNLPLLEAINSGRDVRQMNRAQAAETARVVAMHAPAAPVVVPPAEVRVVNVSDPRAALAALDTAEGKKVLVNIIKSDPNTFRRLLGAS